MEVFLVDDDFLVVDVFFTSLASTFSSTFSSTGDSTSFSSTVSSIFCSHEQVSHSQIGSCFSLNSLGLSSNKIKKRYPFHYRVRIPFLYL